MSYIILLLFLKRKNENNLFSILSLSKLNSLIFIRNIYFFIFLYIHAIFNN
jgi:hypothetical protein